MLIAYIWYIWVTGWLAHACIKYGETSFIHAVYRYRLARNIQYTARAVNFFNFCFFTNEKRQGQRRSTAASV